MMYAPLTPNGTVTTYGKNLDTSRYVYCLKAPSSPEETNPRAGHLDLVKFTWFEDFFLSKYGKGKRSQDNDNVDGQTDDFLPLPSLSNEALKAYQEQDDLTIVIHNNITPTQDSFNNQFIEYLKANHEKSMEIYSRYKSLYTE